MEAADVFKVDRVVVVEGVTDEDIVYTCTSDSIPVTNTGGLMIGVVAIKENNVAQLEFSTANLATFPFHLRLFTVLGGVLPSSSVATTCTLNQSISSTLYRCMHTYTHYSASTRLAMRLPHSISLV